MLHTPRVLQVVAILPIDPIHIIDGDPPPPPQTPPPPLQVGDRAAAISPSGALPDPCAVCRRFALRYDQQLVWDAAPGGKLLGKLQSCFGGTTIQAKCEIHKRCKFLLSQKPALGKSLLHVESDLLCWLAVGTTMDGVGHAQAQRQIKTDIYHMRLKS